MINVRTAFLLYALLLIFSAVQLHGVALYLAIVIVLGLAAKTAVDYFRRGMDDPPEE